MLEKADFKVYLRATKETRTERILKREGGTFEERFRETEERDRNDSARYLRIYNIDNDRPDLVADLIIDTDHLSAEEIVSIIIAELTKKGLGVSTKIRP